MTTRHEFLEALHETLKPRGYLEIGVQTGASLRLASCPALGIDPKPLLRHQLPPSTVVVPCESDHFFTAPPAQQLASGMPQPLDLVFVDGLHLHEQALRDFANAARWANPRTVIVFDDVLPRNQQEAGRTPLPGDWTGDVWKVHHMLAAACPELRLTLVDVEPTGILLVEGASLLPAEWMLAGGLAGDVVPADILQRTHAVSAEVALKLVTS